MMRSNWDSVKSSYWWIIHLDKSGYGNRQDTLVGYSTRVGEVEAKSHYKLLGGCIKRLLISDYFKKSWRIEFFKRAGTAISESDPMIFEIDRGGTVVKHHRDYINDPEWNQFFSRLYECIREGKHPDYLLLTRVTNKDKHLDIVLQTQKIGTDKAELQKYCTNLVRRGHSFEQAQVFYAQYQNAILIPQEKITSIRNVRIIS